MSCASNRTNVLAKDECSTALLAVPSVSAYNTRIRSFSHWARGTRRTSYILADDALAGSLEDCFVGGMWTAHNTMLFMCYSIELLHIFVPADRQDHLVWRCWCLHYEYFMICLQKEFPLSDIRRLDICLYEMQSLFLEIYGDGCWLPKNNFAQHLPLDILRWGPLRSTYSAPAQP